MLTAARRVFIGNETYIMLGFWHLLVFVAKIVAALGCAYMINEEKAHDQKQRGDIVHWLVVIGLFPSNAAAGISSIPSYGRNLNRSLAVNLNHDVEQTALMLFILPELVLSIANFASSYVTRVGVRTNFMRILSQQDDGR